jgi:predicted enzyme involved in methoxymalonyl-ACP biosynthesis
VSSLPRSIKGRCESLILGSWTTDFLREPLANALEIRGFQPVFLSAAFDQYRQVVLTADSDLYRFEPQIVILNLDGQDLLRGLMRNPFGANREERGALAAERGGETASWPRI